MASIAAFPLFKLILVGLRQISKPIADAIKVRAKRIPFFRNYICMPPAYFCNFLENNLKIWTMHIKRPSKMPQLSEEKAIEMGADLLGEFVVFSIASGGLIFEYLRQAENERKKADKLKEEHLKLLDDVINLQAKLEEHEYYLTSILDQLHDLQNKI